MSQPTGVNAFMKLGFATNFCTKVVLFSWGGKIYWPEMPRKSFLGGTVLLTDFSKNIPGGRDLRGINLRPHRSDTCKSKVLANLTPHGKTPNEAFFCPRGVR